MTNCNCNCGCGASTSPQPTYNSRNSVDAFRSEAVRRARTLYLPDKAGTVLIELADSGPTSATVLLMEHRPAENKQHQIQLQLGQPASRVIPAGGYTMLAFAPGFKPHRAYFDLAADQVIKVCVRLDEPPPDPPSFAERLAQYQLQVPAAPSLRNLNVAERTTATLDPFSQEFASDIQTLRIKTVEDGKKILGHSNDYWVGDQARYGKMVEKEPSHMPTPRDEGNLDLNARFALREYIYGNSQAVVGWKKYLDNWLANSEIVLPVFILQDITVGPHAVLYIGSTGLLCHNLNVHYTAKVIVKGSGPTFIDVVQYNQYGFINIPFTGSSVVIKL